ncbi:hypothetical protein GSI_04373 [Ganoderma sinense ZZ0214-1]|uniref:Uncharacterized protein n=1 Tax=Ganoderma sinense ZZ0214-1 TaxID=1077348 RepID=A0A2G8SJM1_9APHY|nr:hypothetical protein GSI_04373 [Ganoderma sinense ZZ0214-1]
MRLPIELCEWIIDEARDDPQSLHQLSLACVAFVHRARYHLFTSIIIRNVKQMESYLEFLAEHPWIPARVQKVTLSASIPKDNDKPNIRLLEVIPAHVFNSLPSLQAWSMEVRSSGHLPLKTPSLSLHRSVLRWYRRHGSRIRNLELDNISFKDISDFMGLVSSLVNIHGLRCSRISFRTEREPESSLAKPGTLRISTLEISTSVDTRAIEYVLARSTATLRSIRFSIFHYYPDYFGRLEKAMRWPKQLTSLVLVVNVGAEPVMDNSNKSLYQFLRGSAGILERVERSHMRDVRVEFNTDPISRLGSCLSHATTSLEACKVLEGALLTFPDPRILVSDVVGVQRAGRADFWSSVIGRAFPTLNERGLLTINAMHTGPLNPPDLLGHKSGVTCLVASHDSKQVVSASLDGTVIIWDSSRGTVLRQWLAHEGAVNDLALSPDDRRLVSVGGNAPVVWAIDNGVQNLAQLSGHKRAVTTCAWSPDGALIASGSRDGTVRIWNSHDPFQQRDMLGYRSAGPGLPSSLQFSPDARYLAWIFHHGCSVWKPLQVVGELPKKLPSHPDRDGVSINAFSFDPESRRVATAHGNPDRQGLGVDNLDACVVRIWDVATGAALAVLTGHWKRVTSVAFSPDGRSLLSASDDKSARVWDVESGEETAFLERVASEVAQTFFSPDGKYGATGASWEGQAFSLWRTEDGSCVAEFDEHARARGRVTHIAFSPNCEFLASGDHDGIVHIRSLLKPLP